jgi:hypothetical protein
MRCLLEAVVSRRSAGPATPDDARSSGAGSTGVVVAERGVGGDDPAQRQVPADGAEVAAGRDQRDRRVVPADVGGGAVGGPVVDYDHGRPFRQA